MSLDVAGTCQTSDPTLTAGQKKSLKLDTAGNLIVKGPTGASSNSIQGPAADGAAAVGNPVQVGGVDGSSNVQALSVDTAGRQLIGAGELHIGEVSNPVTLLTVTPTMDTVAYASGDNLFMSTTCTNAFRISDGLAILDSVTLIDKDDQGVAFDLYFWDANVNMGTINTAPGISDADAANCLAIVPIATADWKDLGGVRVANIKNIWATIKAATGTRNMFMSAINGSGTPTFTASGLVIRLGILPN